MLGCRAVMHLVFVQGRSYAKHTWYAPDMQGAVRAWWERCTYTKAKLRIRVYCKAPVEWHSKHAQL